MSVCSSLGAYAEQPAKPTLTPKPKPVAGRGVTFGKASQARVQMMRPGDTYTCTVDWQQDLHYMDG
jgi:hypothetical protein